MKKQLLKSALIALAGVGLMSGSAMATYVATPSVDSLQSILATQGVTTDVNSGQITQDRYWIPSAGTTSGAWASMLIELSGNSANNTFGIFDQDGTTLDLMLGSANQGDKVNLSWSSSGLFAQYLNYEGGTFVSSQILATNAQISQTFGFYINTGSTTYYSDQTKNTDNSDQMVSYYAFAGHYIIAFEEDLYSTSDKDFNDMVIMVESVQPVPEPASMLLFGTGVIGLAGFVRRKFY